MQWLLIAAFLAAFTCSTAQPIQSPSEPSFVYTTSFLLLNSTVASFNTVYNLAFESAIAKGLKLKESDVVLIESTEQGSSLLRSYNIVAKLQINLPLSVVPDQYDEDTDFLREYIISRLNTIVSRGICTSDFRSELLVRGTVDESITVEAFNVAYPEESIEENSDANTTAEAQEGNLTELIVILCVILGFIAVATFVACSCRLYFLYKKDPVASPRIYTKTIHGLEEHRSVDLQFEYVVDETVRVSKDSHMPSQRGSPGAEGVYGLSTIESKSKSSSADDLGVDLGISIGNPSDAGSPRNSVNSSGSRGSRGDSFSRARNSILVGARSHTNTTSSDGKPDLNELRELGTSVDNQDIADITAYNPPKPRKVEDRSRARNVKKKFETMIANNIDESTGENPLPNSFSRSSPLVEDESIQINWV